MPKLRESAAVLLVLLAPLAVAGCGERTDLQPKPGHQLPQAPLGRPDRPSPHELLTQSSQARPVNSIELRVKSEPRADDPFDIPPKD